MLNELNVQTTTENTMYNYETEKPRLFTEDGQVMFLKVRDQVKKLLAEAGAAEAMKAINQIIK